MSIYTQEQVNYLVEGKLDWETTMRMLSMPKDEDRFRMYVNALQAKLPWDDKVILPISLHLYIAQNKKTKEWVTKCSCGHEFGDYRKNWKLEALVYVRDTPEAMQEVYPALMAPDTNWQVYREYYCPSCGTMHDVEAPTPWYPVMHEFEPDIEAFYKDWVHLPLPEKASH